MNIFEAAAKLGARRGQTADEFFASANASLDDGLPPLPTLDKSGWDEREEARKRREDNIIIAVTAVYVVCFGLILIMLLVAWRAR